MHMNGNNVMEHEVDTLIHDLNQRYRQEFDRAEMLQSELNDIKNSRWWPWFSRLRGISSKLRSQPSPKLIDPPVEVLPSSVSLAEPFQPVSDRNYSASHVSIVIPFRDQHELLERCVLPLHRTVPKAELVLVDNGSVEQRTKNFLHRCRLQHGAQIVHLDEPFNFARLCNAGAAVVHREVLLFLNNDVMAMQPAWLEAMLEVVSDTRVGIVGATLLYPDRTIQHAGLAPTGSGGAWVHPYRHLSDTHAGHQNELRRIRSVPAVTGACLMIRRKLFEEIQGFDHRFPVTMNDVDLCSRVRQKGLQVIITPFARLWHFESLSRGYAREAA